MECPLISGLPYSQFSEFLWWKKEEVEKDDTSSYKPQDGKTHKQQPQTAFQIQIAAWVII